MYIAVVEISLSPISSWIVKASLPCEARNVANARRQDVILGYVNPGSHPVALSLSVYGRAVKGANAVEGKGQARIAGLDAMYARGSRRPLGQQSLSF